MKLPFVSRDRCDRAERQVDQLLQTLVALKQQGFVVPKKAAVTEPVSDEEAVKQAEAGFRAKVFQQRDGFIERTAKDLEARGVPPHLARQEAQRIRGEVESVTMHPGG